LSDNIVPDRQHEVKTFESPLFYVHFKFNFNFAYLFFVDEALLAPDFCFSFLISWFYSDFGNFTKFGIDIKFYIFIHSFWHKNSQIFFVKDPSHPRVRNNIDLLKFLVSKNDIFRILGEERGSLTKNTKEYFVKISQYKYKFADDCYFRKKNKIKK